MLVGRLARQLESIPKKETATMNSFCRLRHRHDGNTEALYFYGLG